MIFINKTNSLKCLTADIIKNTVSNSSNRPIIYIAPESSKATVERFVIDRLRINREEEYKNVSDSEGNDIKINSALIDGDAISFIRLASRINEMCGITSDRIADSVTMRTAIYRILVEHSDEFRSFKKFIGKFEYIDCIIELLGDFARYGIDETVMATVYESASDDSNSVVFADKVHDFERLMFYLKELSQETKIDFVNDQISNANRLLSRLVNNTDLLNTRRYRELSRYIKSTFVVIGFGAVRLFTPQELRFVELCNKLGADFVFYPISSDGIDSDTDVSVYENGDKFISALLKIAPDAVVNDYSPEVVCDPVINRAASDYSYRTIRDNIPEEEKTSNIVGVSIEAVDDRIAYVANEIIGLTRYNDYRYKDIKIVCVDDAIIDRLKSVLSKYQLDFFIDRKILISNTPVFRYALSLTELPIRNFRIEDVLKFLRIGLSDVLPEDVDLLENYCIRNRIFDGNRLFDRDFFVSPDKYYMHAYRDGKDVPAAEYLWNFVVLRVLVPIREIVMEISNADLLSDKSMLLCKHIDSISNRVKYLTDELVDREDNDRALAIVRGYKEVMSLLSSFTLDMCKIHIEQKHFSDLLRIDMRNRSQGSIPLMVDSVDIVTPEQAVVSPSKVMFVLGANSENFPYSSITEGLMTSEELALLSASSENQLPDKFELLTKSRFIVSALLVNSVSERLYFVNEFGVQESSVYTFISNYMSDEALINCYKLPLFGSSVDRRHDFKTDFVPVDVLDSIIGERISVSVTSLEKYNFCHLKYILEDILKIKKREDNREVQVNVAGSIIHKMYEECLREYATNFNSSEDYQIELDKVMTNPEYVSSLSEKYFDAYCIESNNPNEKSAEYKKFPGIKVRRIFERTLPIIIDEIISSKNLPDRFELKIGTDGTTNTLKTSNGTEFVFNGYIDRIDRNEEDNTLRIIDYKTGSKSIDLKKALSGVQIQLFAYANAINNLGDVSSVGYFPIGLKTGDGADVDIKPDISTLNSDDFNVVQEYIDKTIKDSCEEILSGKADSLINRKYGGSRKDCEYCPFASSCGNDKNRPVYRESDFEIDLSARLKTEDIIDEMNRKLGE